MEKEQVTDNSSTEEKIKEAAKRVFTQKGFAATRTRDIAEESGYNLALINYYFRSKEKLFEIIMVEHLQTFVHDVKDILNDANTTLQQKLQTLINHYIDMLIANPDLPLFILREINSDPGKLVEKVRFDTAHGTLHIHKQWKEMEAQRGPLKVNPIHIMINIIGMTVFPFIASPLLRDRASISLDEFNALMQERKQLIPVWINAILNTAL